MKNTLIKPDKNSQKMQTTLEEFTWISARLVNEDHIVEQYSIKIFFLSQTEKWMEPERASEFKVNTLQDKVKH